MIAETEITVKLVVQTAIVKPKILRFHPPKMQLEEEIERRKRSE